MKILLIIPNYNNKIFYDMPIGLTYISSFLKQKGYDVHCLNLNHYNPQKLTRVLQEQSFDVVGTGGLFTHIENIRVVIETTRKYNPQAKIILGGGVATGDPEFIIDELKPDYLVLGEGEITTDNLLMAIKNQTNLLNVTGIAFNKDGSFAKTAPTPIIKDLDSLPYPDYEGFEYEHYINNFSPKDQHLSSITNTLNRRAAFIISSRDCIAKCTFCFRIMGGDFRICSLEYLFGEIRYLVDKYNINELHLMDDMFAANKDRVYEFCRTIKPMGLRWACQVRVNMVNEELLKAMKDSGCFFISYGFESGSNKVLKSMKKGITVNLIEKAIRATLKAKITIQGNFIFGDPSETIQTMEETINFGRKFKTTNIGYRMIAPYPGTVLYENLKEKGMIKDLVSFYNDPNLLINMTSISEIDFLYLCRKVNFENYYRKKFSYGKIYKLRKIVSNVFELSIHCHHCGEKNENLRIDLNEGNMLICKNCYQRVFINMADFRFLNPSEIYQYYYLYIKRIVFYNDKTHRFLFFVPTFIEKMAGILRRVVNFMLNVSEFLNHKCLAGKNT